MSTDTISRAEAIRSIKEAAHGSIFEALVMELFKIHAAPELAATVIELYKAHIALFVTVLEECPEVPAEETLIMLEPEKPVKRPRMTYAQDFFTAFPKAASYNRITKDGLQVKHPTYCRAGLYGPTRCPGGENVEGGHCVACWEELMPEED